MVDQPAATAPITAPLPVKQAHFSLTIWGAAIATLAQVLAETTAIIDQNMHTHLSADPIVIKVITICGTITAIIGRIRATTIIQS